MSVEKTKLEGSAAAASIDLINEAEACHVD
jgi:hypothetical protein